MWEKLEMAHVKAKYKTLWSEDCGGVGTYVRLQMYSAHFAIEEWQWCKAAQVELKGSEHCWSCYKWPVHGDRKMWDWWNLMASMESNHNPVISNVDFPII